MTPAEPVVLVYGTCPDMGCAAQIANVLIDARLAACVNMIPGMVSVYRWQGEVARDDEVVIIVKTRQDLAESVVGKIKSNHPYDTPSVMVLPVTAGNPDFFSWVAEETNRPASEQS